MENPDWTVFTRKILIKAPLDKVFQCWSTPAGLESWFLKGANYQAPDGIDRTPTELIKTGDSYKWTWHNWDGMEQGRVLSTNSTDSIEFTFIQSIVNVHLKQIEDQTLVVLTQSEISQDEQSKMKVYFNCGTGWTFWLTNLKAFLEHGILLNNSTPGWSDKHSTRDFINV